VFFFFRLEAEFIPSGLEKTATIRRIKPQSQEQLASKSCSIDS